MKIIIFGAAGFIGTNLAVSLAQDKENKITLIDRDTSFFELLKEYKFENVKFYESDFTEDADFEHLLEGQDVVYHLISTTVPTTSNQHIPQELVANVVVSSKLLESCVKCGVRKVIFISSGGTVYGKQKSYPISEESSTYPISSYGIQKITIEKLLYLYQYMYGLDYRVIRLSNPYGPYQRPNGILGAVTTFTYKSLLEETIDVYGDGTVIRDYIYIDDAIKGIVNIANNDNKYRTFNLGCGYGTSINDLLEIIKDTLNVKLNVNYHSSRRVDIPVNYLDISRYEECFGPLNPLGLKEGVLKTANFLENKYIEHK